jgi:hypothetical protein
MTRQFRPYRDGDPIPPPPFEIEPVEVTIRFRGRTHGLTLPAESDDVRKRDGLAYVLDLAVRTVVEAVLAEHTPAAKGGGRP